MPSNEHYELWLSGTQGVPRVHFWLAVSSRKCWRSRRWPVPRHVHETLNGQPSLESRGGSRMTSDRPPAGGHPPGSRASGRRSRGRHAPDARSAWPASWRARGHRPVAGKGSPITVLAVAAGSTRSHPRTCQAIATPATRPLRSIMGPPRGTFVSTDTPKTPAKPE
jgi:hypothetical protein